MDGNAPPDALSATGLRTARALTSAEAKPTFGIGLNAQGAIADGPSTYVFTYCEVPNMSPCPADAPGEERAKYAVSKKFSLPSYGQASLTMKATSELGSVTYAQSAFAKPARSDSSAPNSNGQSNFNWIDVLHVKSATLPNGAPVTLVVSLALTKKDQHVPCEDASGGAAATMQVQGAGVDAQGNPVGVFGGCDPESSGKFIYALGALDGPLGTEDRGLISTIVGASIEVGSHGSVSTESCGSSSCDGAYLASLSGTAKWHIESISAGAYYTTDSGRRY